MDTISPQAAAKFPLPTADLESLGFRREQIDRLLVDGPFTMNTDFRFEGNGMIVANGNILIADSKNTRIRSIDANTGTITTIAGGGAPAEADTAPTITARQADPMAYAIQNRIGDSHPLDFNNIGTLGQQLAQRVGVAQTMSERYQVPMSLLTKQEAATLNQGFQNMLYPQRLQYLEMLRTNVTNPQAYSSVLQQIAPDHPVVAAAGVLLLAGEAVLGSAVFAEGAHGAAGFVGVFQAIEHHVVIHLVVPHAVTASPFEQQIRGIGHALHAAGDDHVVAASHQHVMREHGRLHA